MKTPFPKHRLTLLAAALCLAFPVIHAEELSGNTGTSQYTGTEYELAGNITSTFAVNAAAKPIISSANNAQTVSSTDNNLSITAGGGQVFYAQNNNQTIDLAHVVKISAGSGKIFWTRGNLTEMNPDNQPHQKVTGYFDELNANTQSARMGVIMKSDGVIHNNSGVQIFGNSIEDPAGAIGKITVNSTSTGLQTNRGTAIANIGSGNRGTADASGNVPHAASVQRIYMPIGQIGESSSRFFYGVFSQYGTEQYIHQIGNIYAMNIGIAAGDNTVTSDCGWQYINSVDSINIDNTNNNGFAWGIHGWTDDGVKGDVGSQYVGVKKDIVVNSSSASANAVGINNWGGEQVIEAKPDDPNGSVTIRVSSPSQNNASSLKLSTYYNDNGADVSTTLKGSFTLAAGDIRVQDSQRNPDFNASLNLVQRTVSYGNDDSNPIISNTMTLGDGVNIRVTTETDTPRSFLILGDDRNAKDKGYNIVMGENSFINVQGVFKGTGTITAHTNGTAIDSNGVLLKHVQKTPGGNKSLLNVSIDKNSDDFDENSAMLLMKSAVNNIFVDEGKANITAGTVFLNEGLVNNFSSSFYYADSETVGNPNDIKETLAGKTTLMLKTSGNAIADEEGKLLVTDSRGRTLSLAKNEFSELKDSAGNAITYHDDGTLTYTDTNKPISVNSDGKLVDEDGNEISVSALTDNAKAFYAWEGELGVEPVNESTSTMDTIDSVGMTNYFLWRQENETLYQRMGEVRDRPDLEGGWIRILHGRNSYDKKGGYFRNDYTGIQLGFDHFDKENDGKWTWGGAFTYTKGDSKLTNGGSADNWLGSLSFYGTRKYENGGYLDLIVKGTHMHNDFTAISDQFRYVTKGGYHTNAWQASAEYGRKFHMDKKKEWYLDPQLQLTLGHINGVKYRTDNNLNVRIKGTDSVIGRIGMALGREWKQGSAFVKLDGLREFAARYKAHYSLDNGVENRSRISMKDTWGEISAGGSYNFNKDTFGFMQVKRSFAADIQTDYRFDIGLRYQF